MRLIFTGLACLFLCGCNSVYYVPGSLEPDATVYARPGGYSMQRSVKLAMEENNHHVIIGKYKKSSNGGTTETYELPKDVRYYVRVRERKEFLRPIWCMFNGFWWWNFEMTIQDRETSSEILSWRGRGCANSSLRKLKQILQDMKSKNMATNIKQTKKLPQTTIEEISESDSEFND